MGDLVRHKGDYKNFDISKRKDIFKYLNNVDKNKVLIFRRRKDLNKWYRNQFNTNIEIGGLKESQL